MSERTTFWLKDIFKEARHLRDELPSWARHTSDPENRVQPISRERTEDCVKDLLVDLASRDAEIERLKAELGNLFAATAPLLALVEQLAVALEEFTINAECKCGGFDCPRCKVTMEEAYAALSAAAAYRKERG